MRKHYILLTIFMMFSSCGDSKERDHDMEILGLEITDKVLDAADKIVEEELKERKKDR